MFKLELGQTVQDKISNFKGTIIGRATYLNGYIQCLIMPCTKDVNVQPKSQWIDEEQLEVTGVNEKAIEILSRKANSSGGPVSKEPTNILY